MKKEPQAVKCIVCSSTFMAKRSDAKFCTPNCRQKFVRNPEKYSSKPAPPEDKKKDPPPPPDPPKEDKKQERAAIPSKEIKGDSWWEQNRKKKLGLP